MDTSVGPLIMPKDGLHTAYVLNFFNDLFDSCNGHTKNQSAPLRNCVSNNSEHNAFWMIAREKLNDMHFVVGPEKRRKKVPSLINWDKTIKGFQQLWELLKKNKIARFSPRNINQDPLENFFGTVRSHGHRNINPIPTHFEAVFKALLINNLTSCKTVKGNCEDTNDGKLLFTLENFLRDAHSNELNSNIDKCEDMPYAVTKVQSKAVRESTSSLHNIVKKMLLNKEIYTCQYCTVVLQNTKALRTTLVHATIALRSEIRKVCHLKNIKNRLALILTNSLEFTFISCNSHFESFQVKLINIIIKDYLTHWCRNINRLLTGQNKLDRDNMALQAWNRNQKRF